MQSPSPVSTTSEIFTNDACKVLVQALVTSRLVYGNVLLQGLPQVLIERLQRIQNCTALLITRSRKSVHITPVLCELHWLLVKYWLRFKVNTLTYKVLNGLAPYMSDIVQKHQPVTSRCTCAMDCNLWRTLFQPTCGHSVERLA